MSGRRTSVTPPNTVSIVTFLDPHYNSLFLALNFNNMEPLRSTSRSRRSYPNLHNLSIAPLSAKYPLDASVPPSPDEPGTRTPRTSYIAQKSAPATPGVLSLSQSRSSSRQRPKKAYAYESYFVNPHSEVREVGDIPKAKSTSVLHPGVSFADDVLGVDTGKKRHHTRKGKAPLPLQSPLVKHHTRESNEEWLHREFAERDLAHLEGQSG